MRNKHPGECYRCGKWVKVGEGHFERFRGGWRVQHATCAIEHSKKQRDVPFKDTGQQEAPSHERRPSP